MPYSSFSQSHPPPPPPGAGGFLRDSETAFRMAGAVLPVGVARDQIDLMNLGWEAQWDCAFLLDVIEPLPDDVQAMRQAAQALEPGGLLVVTTAALQQFWSYNDDLRLAHYCLDLSALYDTERVVLVVIFLQPGRYLTHLTLGSETMAYLRFCTIAYALFATPAREHLHSDNLIARLALPTMAYAPSEKLEVYAAAMRGLLELEPDPERRLKYADFVDIYAALDDNELAEYRQRYPQEASTMSGFAARFIEQGIKKGAQLGYQKGEASLLLRQLTKKFGAAAATAHRQRIENAEPELLETWSERILSAERVEDIFV